MTTPRAHEKTDLQPKYVLYFAIALVVTGAAIFVAIWWMFHTFEPEPARLERQPVPEPRLQINPQGDLEKLQRQEEEMLSTYGWIDRNQGTARIPIDRAMKLFLERQER